MSDEPALFSVSIIMPAVAVLIVLLTWLAARGTLPMNPIAGLRVPATMRSPGAWRAGHRAAVPATIGTAVLVIIGATILLVVHPETDAGMTVSTLVLAAILVLGMIVACVFASRAARDAD
jgi:hypothetical protein